VSLKPDDPSEIERLNSTVEAFIVRARRVASHSLVQDQESLERLSAVTVRIEGPPDVNGEVTMIDQLFPEEAVESLAARVRPLILQSDPVFYNKVLKALSRLAHLAGHEDVVAHVKRMRADWTAADPSESGGMHFGIEVGKVGGGPGIKATDVALALAWFYGDVIHADPERRASARPFSIETRFIAATSHVGRLASVAIDTLEFVEWLHQSNTITFDQQVFDEEVAVQRSEIRRKTKIYWAPMGTPEPADITQPFGDGWTLGIPGMEDP
jgi:hypothetical protein